MMLVSEYGKYLLVFTTARPQTVLLNCLWVEFSCGKSIYWLLNNLLLGKQCVGYVQSVKTMPQAMAPLCNNELYNLLQLLLGYKEITIITWTRYISQYQL